MRPMHSCEHVCTKTVELTSAPQSASARPQLRVTSWMLFAVGLILGGVLASYVPYQFIFWSLEQFANGDRGWVLASGGLFLGIVSLVTGARWCFLFVLSFRTF